MYLSRLSLIIALVISIAVTPAAHAITPRQKTILGITAGAAAIGLLSYVWYKKTRSTHKPSALMQNKTTIKKSTSTDRDQEYNKIFEECKEIIKLVDDVTKNSNTSLFEEKLHNLFLATFYSKISNLIEFETINTQHANLIQKLEQLGWRLIAITPHNDPKCPKEPKFENLKGCIIQSVNALYKYENLLKLKSIASICQKEYNKELSIFTQAPCLNLEEAIKQIIRQKLKQKSLSDKDYQSNLTSHIMQMKLEIANCQNDKNTQLVLEAIDLQSRLSLISRVDFNH